MANSKKWNWQQKDWPNFTYNAEQLIPLNEQFLRDSWILLGTYKHINKEEHMLLTIETMSDEAMKTSEIEGEILNRDSVQSSIRRNFGLDTSDKKIPLAEKGIADMMIDLYKKFDKKLDSKMIFNWHTMLMKGRKDLKNIGSYRTDKEAMQVVSGPMYEPKVHFQAPDAKDVKREMNRFIKWFNDTAPTGPTPLPALIRSGIAHLFFVCIHPFEDGNGRIARALSIKVLSESIQQPILIALSNVIQSNRKKYYLMLEKNNKDNEITEWLKYFSETVLMAQNQSLKLVEFLIYKTKFYEKYKDQMNERQLKLIARMFKEGISGFKGGLSAEKYISIAKTSRATATRDLQDLVEKKVMTKTGTLKSTRYYLSE